MFQTRGNIIEGSSNHESCGDSRSLGTQGAGSEFNQGNVVEAFMAIQDSWRECDCNNMVQGLGIHNPGIAVLELGRGVVQWQAT